MTSKKNHGAGSFTLKGREATVVEPYFSVGKHEKKPKNMSEKEWQKHLDDRYPLRKKLKELENRKGKSKSGTK